MKKFLISLSIAVLVFGIVGIASATPCGNGTCAGISFTDITCFTPSGTVPGGDLDDYGWGAVNKLDGFGDYVAWSHNFTFNPPAAEILSGELTIYLNDDGGDTWSPFSWEFGITALEDGTFAIDEVDTGAYTYDVDVAYLADGEFSVFLSSVGGDFYINKSKLEVCYNPVPEPTTMLLLGSGLIGLAGAGRRKTKGKKAA